MDNQSLSQQIKAEALRLGFSACGIAKANALLEDAAHLKNWLEAGRNADMDYMANHFEKRVDPRLLVEGTKSVVVVLLNYFPETLQEKELPQIAKYAYGKDYHELIKSRLTDLLGFVQTILPEAGGRVFTDSAPILEKRWAVQAGLGRIGKNTTLIHPDLGSFCFIGEMLLNIELDYDTPSTLTCGTCTRCIQACPTGALSSPQVLNACKCLSYHTIENKGDIPENIQKNMSNRLFGCDICLDVCPWNIANKATECEDLKPLDGILEIAAEDWLQMTEEEFNARFKDSPLKRAGLEKIKNNIRVIEEKKLL